jgi:hypothetical protein
MFFEKRIHINIGNIHLAYVTMQYPNGTTDAYNLKKALKKI